MNRNEIDKRIAEVGAPPTEKFWMVVRHDGRPPAIRHSTRKAAEMEANRLAQREISTFFVLEAVKVFTVEIVGRSTTLGVELPC